MPSLVVPLMLRATVSSVSQTLVVAHQALDGALAALDADPAYGSAHRQALALARALVAAVLPEPEETRHDG